MINIFKKRFIKYKFQFFKVRFFHHFAILLFKFCGNIYKACFMFTLYTNYTLKICFINLSLVIKIIMNFNPENLHCHYHLYQFVLVLAAQLANIQCLNKELTRIFLLVAEGKDSVLQQQMSLVAAVEKMLTSWKMVLIVLC